MPLGLPDPRRLLGGKEEQAKPATSKKSSDSTDEQQASKQGKGPLGLIGSSVDLAGDLIRGGAELTLDGVEAVGDASGKILKGSIDLSSDALRFTGRQFERAITEIKEFDPLRTPPELAGKAFEGVLQGLVDFAEFGGKTVDTSMDLLVEDPDAESGLAAKGIRLGIGLLPIVGNVQGVAEARMRHRKARSIEDPTEREKELREARKDCLIVVMALGLEVGTLGASDKIQKGVNGAGITLSALQAGRILERFSSENAKIPALKLDFLSAPAGAAVDYRPVRDSMEFILSHELKTQEKDTRSEDSAANS